MVPNHPSVYAQCDVRERPSYEEAVERQESKERVERLEAAHLRGSLAEVINVGVSDQEVIERFL